jgi:hypothetical protein
VSAHAAEPPTHVTKADGDQVVVEVHGAGDAVRLASLGFTTGPDAGIPPALTYVAPVPDEGAKVRVFAALRDAGVPFAAGREWSPAELFEWFRDRRLLAGGFRSIAWRGPGQWVVRDEA